MGVYNMPPYLEIARNVESVPADNVEGDVLAWNATIDRWEAKQVSDTFGDDDKLCFGDDDDACIWYDGSVLVIDPDAATANPSFGTAVDGVMIPGAKSLFFRNDSSKVSSPSGGVLEFRVSSLTGPEINFEAGALRAMSFSSAGGEFKGLHTFEIDSAGLGGFNVHETNTEGLDTDLLRVVADEVAIDPVASGLDEDGNALDIGRVSMKIGSVDGTMLRFEWGRRAITALPFMMPVGPVSDVNMGFMSKPHRWHIGGLPLGAGVDSNLVMTGLPTSAPAESGAVWNNAGVLTIVA